MNMALETTSQLLYESFIHAFCPHNLRVFDLYPFRLWYRIVKFLSIRIPTMTLLGKPIKTPSFFLIENSYLYEI